MKKIIATLMLALGLAASTPGVAQAVNDGGNLSVNQYSSHSVYYRYNSTNTLAYAAPGSGAPFDRDVNYVQVGSCWRLRYALTGDIYAKTSAYNVYVGNTQTIIVYDYYKVC